MMERKMLMMMMMMKIILFQILRKLDTNSGQFYSTAFNTAKLWGGGGNYRIHPQ
jgi:hypothetical protein